MYKQLRERKREDHIVYFDLLRIISVFAMMVVHVSASKVYAVPVTGSRFTALVVYGSLSRFCVPCFAMISGALFVDPRRNVTMEKLLKKNLLRIVTAFAFWSGLYAVILNVLEHGTLNAGMTGEILTDFILGPTPLWFMYMIAGMYLIVPFLRLIAEKTQLVEYFLLLAFIVVFGLTFLQRIPALNSVIAQILDKAELQFVAGYSSYFFAGYYLHRYQIPDRVRKGIYLAGVAGTAVTIGGAWTASQAAGKLAGGYYNYFSLNVLCMSLAVFLLVQQVGEKIRLSEKTQKWVSLIARYSFGMYLCHEFVNVLFEEHLGITVLLFNSYLSVPVITLCVFVLSFLMIAVIDRIPGLQKYVM